MRRRRSKLGLAASLVPFLALFAAAQGCYSVERVKLHVLDAETLAPIAGANVRIRYYAKGIVLQPLPPMATAVTGADGLAKVPMARGDYFAVALTVRAPGYWPLGSYLTPHEAIETAARQRRNGGWLDEFNQYLFRPPLPQVAVIVPAGYRGPLEVRLIDRDDTRPPPGQRMFTYEFTPGEPIEIPYSWVIQRFSFDSLSGHFTDGRPLPAVPRVGPASRSALNNEVRLRYLGLRGDLHLFAVGTEKDADAARTSFAQPPGTRPPSVSSK